MSKFIEKINYKKRIIDSKIEEYLKVCGALCIEGPKWCGKSSTSSYHCKSEFLGTHRIDEEIKNSLGVSRIN